MNDTRRNELRKVYDIIDEAINTLTGLMDEEIECRDNIPESLQNSPNYEKSEMAIDAMESAIESLVEAQDSIDEAQQ